MDDMWCYNPPIMKTNLILIIHYIDKFCNNYAYYYPKSILQNIYAVLPDLTIAFLTLLVPIAILLVSGDFSKSIFDKHLAFHSTIRIKKIIVYILLIFGTQIFFAKSPSGTLYIGNIIFILISLSALIFLMHNITRIYRYMLFDDNKKNYIESFLKYISISDSSYNQLKIQQLWRECLTHDFMNQKRLELKNFEEIAIKYFFTMLGNKFVEANMPGKSGEKFIIEYYVKLIRESDFLTEPYATNHYEVILKSYFSLYNMNSSVVAWNILSHYMFNLIAIAFSRKDLENVFFESIDKHIEKLSVSEKEKFINHIRGVAFSAKLLEDFDAKKNYNVKLERYLMSEPVAFECSEFKVISA